MPVYDLVCSDCSHTFAVTTRVPIKDRQKRCPECSSTRVRQKFSSYLRNGSLSDPACGAPRSSGFG